PLLLPDVVNRADVRMVQGRGGSGLALKSLHRMVVLGNFIGQEFESDLATEPGIFGLVDHTHATAPQFLQDAVVRDGLAEHGSASVSFAAIIGSTLQASQRGGVRKCSPFDSVRQKGQPLGACMS